MTKAAFLNSLRLCRDERGIGTIELGLIAPVLALFVVGVADLSQALSRQFTMQQAVSRSLEMLMANPTQADPDSTDVDYSFLIEETAAAAGVASDKVTLTRWLECSGVRQDSFTGGCTAEQESTRYVSISINETFTGKMNFASFPIKASGALRVQ